MCGLHGFFTGKSNVSKASSFLSDGYVAGSLRGMDSSGIASIDTHNSFVEWQKLPIPGTYFREDRVVRRLLSEANNKNQLTICHTRAATSGAVSVSNAHPFITDNDDDANYRELIGVHNGSLTGWGTHKTGKNYSVDSEWALNLIFEEGMDAFKNIRGAYCFVFWDSFDEDNLNIALNDQRPMNVAFMEDGSMAFASEAGMLYWLLERNDVKIDGPVLQLAAGNWYKFPKGDMKNFTKEAIPVPVVVPTTVYNYHGQGVRTTYSSASVVEKVAALFTKVKAQLANVSTDNVTPTLPKVPFVSRDEARTATELGIQGTKGKLITSFYDATDETLHGTFLYEGEQELSCIMRNAKGVKWTNDIALEVTVLGLIDDGRELTAIVSKPRVKAPLTAV